MNSIFSVQNLPSNSGFTLLELLVVISLLAIVSGSVVLGYEDVQSQGREYNTDFEMAELRKALLQFRRDSGSNHFPHDGVYDCDNDPDSETYIPNPAIDPNFPTDFPSDVASLSAADRVSWCKNSANFWMLFDNPLGKPWNKDRRRGWNGPYLRNRQIPVDFDTESALAGILDPYGNPYLLEDMNTEDARIVSMGQNGLYEGENASNACLPNDASDVSDDRILCLLK